MTISREIKAQMITLHEHTSKTQREIADELLVSQTLVARTIQIWMETGSLEEHKEDTRGNKWKLCDRDVRKLCIEAKKDPQKSARELQQEAGPSVQAVHVRTLQRYLNKSGIKSYRPQKMPFHTNLQFQRRLHWAKERVNVSEDFWDEVSLLKRTQGIK